MMPTHLSRHRKNDVGVEGALPLRCFIGSSCPVLLQQQPLTCGQENIGCSDAVVCCRSSALVDLIYYFGLELFEFDLVQ